MTEFYGSYIGFGAGGAAAPTFYTDIVGAGFGTNLKLVLDAGAAASYTSGQKWLDLAGGGYDFFLGSSASASSDDPTHNGTPGALSSSEYFSLDGGDFFQYDTTNESWMDNFHKDNASWTICMWVYRTTEDDNPFVTASSGSSYAQGFIFYEDGAARLNVDIYNGSGQALTGVNLTGFSDDTWHMVSGRIDETDGSAGHHVGIDTTYTSATDGTISSPSSSAASAAFKIGGASWTNMKSGGRIGGVFIWEGTTLSTANITSVRNATKARWGL